jgi:hypothetical protein
VFWFVVKVVLVSIAVSLLARWAKLIPRYPKLRYAVLFQVLNTGLLTALLTFLLLAGIDLSWVILLVLLLAVQWLALLCTNAVAQRSAGSEDAPRIRSGRAE